MTLAELNAKIRSWDLQSTGSAVADSKYSQIFDQLSYHASKDWRVYLPAEHPDFNSSYLERLASWIGNVTDEAEQKLLLEYALCISFFSHEDFTALYRTALNREISRWVATQVNASLQPGGAQAFQELVNRQIHRHTWFCPVTDSLDINEFYKVNHLKGIGHRPCFATLQMLAERSGIPNPTLAQNITSYMANPSGNAQRPAPPLQRLVLLEDIVGSGSQCVDAVSWAVANLGKPVLLVPLILCPTGSDALNILKQQSNGMLTVSPVIELKRSDLLGPERNGQPGLSIANDMEDFARRYATRASAGMDIFGYLNTGCSLATFSNTPDNTLPLVHNKPIAGGWEPLLPRVFRE